MLEPAWPWCFLRRPPLLLPAAAQGFAQGHAEAVALLGATLHVAPGLRLFFHPDRLRARKADALATVLDGQHGHLDLGAGREILSMVRVFLRAHLGIRDETDLPRADTEEDAERLDALDRAGDDGSHGDLGLHVLSV